jgi:hypothetical protein
MSYEHFDDMVVAWLKGETYQQHCPERGATFLRNHVNVYKATGVFAGTAAIHYNDTVLTTPLPFPNEHMDTRIASIARDLGFTPHSISAKQMNTLRACLTPEVPKIGSIKSMVRFKASLGDLASTFPNMSHPNSLVKLARATNALFHRGKYSVIMAEHTPDGPRILAFYQRDDEAVEELMRMKDTTNIQLLEI